MDKNSGNDISNSIQSSKIKINLEEELVDNNKLEENKKKIHQKESYNIITNKNYDRDDICPINMIFGVEKKEAKEEDFGFNLFSLEEKETIKEKMIIDNNNNFIDFNKINNIKEEKNCNDKKDETDSATKNVFPDNEQSDNNNYPSS